MTVRRGSAVLLLLALASIALLLLVTRKETYAITDVSSPLDVEIAGKRVKSSGGLSPGKFEMYGRTHYFQVPPAAKGTFVFLHGCARSPTGFWPESPACSECNAFPEGVSHTIQALKNRYAILVPSPQNRNTCFSGSDGDIERTPAIIEKFLSMSRLKGKPVILGGASAGGSVAIRMVNAGKIKVSGLLLEVATSFGPEVSSHFPPTVWVVMERDTASQREARSYAASLRKRGVGADVIVSPIRKVTPTFFSDRLFTITPAESEKLVAALKKIGVLDNDGNVRRDPNDESYRKKWMKALKPLVPKTKPFTLEGSTKTSPILQALAVAYAQHEAVGDYTTAALKFFESGGRSKMRA